MHLHARKHLVGDLHAVVAHLGQRLLQRLEVAGDHGRHGDGEHDGRAPCKKHMKNEDGIE
jgi:hypothetical protein